jgi:hypothetical protein
LLYKKALLNAFSTPKENLKSEGNYWNVENKCDTSVDAAQGHEIIIIIILTANGFIPDGSGTTMKRKKTRNEPPEILAETSFSFRFGLVRRTGESTQLTEDQRDMAEYGEK